jgi:putative FmdB family regulatory protein
MPIYAYRCSNCGHAQDALQKISDPVLTVCPACGQASYVKQVTAAGFQLKGSGWYVTDFRGDGKAGKAADGAAGDKAADKAGGDKAAETKGGEAASKSDAGSGDGAGKAENAPAAAPAPAAASPAAAPPAPGSAGKTGG